ncbi:MAG: DHH family phosphoesterase [Myxococcales bacterium]|nr:DHH family phosphoesterase [Myxococcales bacterium]
MMTSREPEAHAEALALIRGGKRFLVTCHRRPDGDALGSAMGLSDVLRVLGKDVVTYCPDDVPETLAFLLGVEGLCRNLDDVPGAFDATFVMDTASRVLLPKGFPERDRSGPVVVVDHHAAHEDFADVVVRDARACATGEIVLDLAASLGVARSDLTLVGATGLYGALVADTGGFRFEGTTPKTLRMAADLLEKGVDPWNVAYTIFEGWPPERVALLQEALAGLELHNDGRLAVLKITQEMLERTGATAEMVDGLVTFGRSVRGVEVAVLLWEQDEASSDYGTVPATKVSYRSRGAADVSALAVSLGGGGHRAAAAACVRQEMDVVRERVLKEASALLTS